ncbi:MAG: S8 family serine peptidase [Roseivirga sp.]|nr:S8 family serine peptidase [Roseivirga sp.]
MKKILLLATFVACHLSMAQEKVFMTTKTQGKIEFEISEEYFWFEAGPVTEAQLKARAGNDKFSLVWRDRGFLRATDRVGSKFQISKQHMKRKYGEKMKKLSPVLISKDGEKQVIQDRIFLKMNGIAPSRSLIKKFKTVFTPVKYMKDLYLVEISGADAFDILDIIAYLNKHENVEYAEPDFLRIIKLATSDSFYHNQWGLENDGSTGTADADIDVEGAWQYATGQGIKVAVLDNGVDLNHEDLSANLLPGYDATDRSLGGYSEGNDYHGTAVSGIIAAVANNNKGIAGVAYDSKVIPIRITYSSRGGSVYSESWLLDGINEAVALGADVINMSLSYDHANTPIYTALNNATSSGRGGLGIVVVAATGNGNSGSVSTPADQSNTLAVGASSFCDKRWSPTGCTPYPTSNKGSNYGSQLDVVAPGRDLWTLDNTGILGRNPGNYDGDFTGTSAAAPIVSGVAALILSVDPALTGVEVMNLIRRNAEKVGGYSYNTTSGKPEGTWNNEMGYGRVNAKEAVEEAFFDLVKIAGSQFTCMSRSSTNYNLTNLPAGITATSWSSSSNITITSSSSTGVSLTATQNGFSAWVRATLSNGVVIERDIWAGKPAMPASISGPATVQSGAYVNYTGTVTNGASSYQWLVPYPHQVVSSFNIFGADWQMLNITTTSTHLNAFSGTSGSDGYVQFSGVNSCGVGPARTLYVTHDSGGGGAIPKVEGKSLRVNVYPNPANDIVNIELSSTNRDAVLLSLELVDQRLVTQYRKGFGKGVTEFSLDVRSLDKGIYELRMKTTNGPVNRRIIIE